MDEVPQSGRLLDVSQSALKHGFTVADAQRVFDTYIHNSPMKDRDGVEIMLGYSVKGALLELFYETKADRTVVFHMMECRKQYLERLRWDHAN
jgi:hypothetical protein